MVSSLDGYCSFISFKDGELGKPVTFDPMEYVTNKMKARKEARKEAKKEQVTERRFYLFQEIINLLYLPTNI